MAARVEIARIEKTLPSLDTKDTKPVLLLKILAGRQLALFAALTFLPGRGCVK